MVLSLTNLLITNLKQTKNLVIKRYQGFFSVPGEVRTLGPLIFVLFYIF